MKKSQEEKLILKYFSSEYADFPKGKLVKTESPDFILKLNPKRSIGIELTRLYQPKSNNQEFKPKQVESLEKKIVGKAQKTYESNNKYKLYLTVFFSSTFKISKSQTTPFENEITQLVHKKTHDNDFGSFFRLNIEKSELPKHIDLIQIIYHPEVKISFWNSGGGYLIPELSKEYLENTINSKEEKLRLYQKRKIDKFWLIITINFFNRSTSFNINNKIDNWTFDSKFHKVFLFELFNRKIFELK